MSIMSKIVDGLYGAIHPEWKSSDSFVKHLRETGTKVGEGTYFFDPTTTNVDIRRRDYIEIGKYCCITQGVQLLCHDYSWSSLRKVYHDILPDPGRKITIGDNVFLGWNSIVIGNVQIGSNVIIGAHSVVTKDIPSNTVWAGNPAKQICTLDEYYERKKERRLTDAFDRARHIYDLKHRIPTMSEMGWFSVLFLERTKENETFLRNLPFKGDNMDWVIEDFYNSKPIFTSFDEFISNALERINQ